MKLSFMTGKGTTNNGRRNLFNNGYSNKTGSSGSSGSSSNSGSSTITQIATLNTVRQNYSLLLSEKKYEQIPSNYTIFLKLLNSLKSIIVYDKILALLISIAENALVGAINVNTIYTSYAYNEIKIALLNKRIEDILSNKNVISIITSTTSTMSITKTMKLSPIYSYYIYLYGLPAYGIGFDPAKLNFIQKLPFLMDMEYDCK